MQYSTNIEQYPLAETMHPWAWLQKWELDLETAAALLGIERPHSFYRWHPAKKGKEKRTPTIQIQVACALYDKIWQQTGCPYTPNKAA
jgi:hypothetical protein